MRETAPRRFGPATDATRRNYTGTFHAIRALLAVLASRGYGRTMPGPAHETLVALLQQRPDLLDLLLRALGRGGLPGKVTPRDSAARVANPLEVRPDLILVSDGETGAWVIVEVQLGRDEDKQRRWLAAAGVLLDTRGTMGDVVVITHDASVAAWAGEVARVVGPAGTRFALEPVVVRLTLAEVEPLLASGRAELAVFAAWAVHDQRGRDAQRVVQAAADVIASVSDAGLRQALSRAMISMLGEPLLAALREMLMNPQTIPESPGYRALRQEIEAIGEARGRALGEADALLVVLDARGFTVDAATRERIVRCGDVEQLRRWIARAVTARSLGEVFESDG